MLTAGALALAVIAPAVDPAEHATEAAPAPTALPANPESPAFAGGFAARDSRILSDDLDESLFMRRQAATARATRAMQRRAVTIRPAPLAPLRARPGAPSPGAAPTGRSAAGQRLARSASGQRAGQGQRSASGQRGTVEKRPAFGRHSAENALQRAVRAAQHRTVAQRRTTVSHRGMVRRTTHRTVSRTLRVSGGTGRMAAVIAYAKAQLGSRYVTGGEGRGGFDCSGLTRQAYARAGMRLPHSSRAQAARARSVARGQARPGDLVVGSGHVGIYMGRGMMIDAGNHRTGVVYRRMYRGLRVERIPGA
ncbi:Gamma-DL-glutamyl hydrolase [Actinoplanes sp. SE50]|uniref:C40 family peptidase n=1 Tax=unclassified Actinoplanes TaxID=2626549 RepID=UPI00023EDD19|nr:MULTISPECIES: NlpC/P60 family protein [unclassified Actinoplanes]AEV89132.1 Gamma-DL-glutamyl hydrolase [Actinoplanes sp. SE50/110]ATO87538.1 Gamma-DL-glutamyl hydrolase [Actinoplanes sp. SE50]SLM04956.1 putative endopeptidase p60 precursor [Actinoplanes sp. SE50/110]